MAGQRIHWIDIARGIGILLVIYAHALDSHSMRYLFYAFHMPLFFFLSGLVHHHRKQEKFLHFLKKSFMRIMIPYFFFALISYLLYLFKRGYPPGLNEFSHHLYGVVYGSSGHGYLFFSAILWFLPCLFATKIIFELLIRISENKYFLGGSLFFFSVVGYLFSLYFPEKKLPLGIEIALTATVFFGIGYFLYLYKEQVMEFCKKHFISVFTLSLLLLIIPAVINYKLYGNQIDLRMNNLNNYFLFYLAAISGILFTTAISIRIDKNNVLEYIGKNSLPLFAFHQIVISYITMGLATFLTIQQISSLRNIYLAPFYTIVSTLVIFAGLLIIEKVKSKSSAIIGKK